MAAAANRKNKKTKKAPSPQTDEDVVLMRRRKVIRRHVMPKFPMIVGTKTMVVYPMVNEKNSKGQMVPRITMRVITVDRVTPNPRNRNARINGMTVGNAWKANG